MCAECYYVGFIAQCRGILLDVEELPERAEEFAASVTEKITSMQTFAEINQHVTDKQREAAENMAAGVKRWLR